MGALRSARLSHLLGVGAEAEAETREDAPSGASTGVSRGARSDAGTLTAAVDWQARLSRGEAQRLGLARVLFHSPDIVVLDEATAALDADAEAAVLAALGDAGVGVIACAHHGVLTIERPSRD